MVGHAQDIRLPAATRKRLGIKGGDVVILEDRGNEIVLEPGMVLEVQHYRDDQIAQWDADDRLEDREREGPVHLSGRSRPGCDSPVDR